jgi:uncharacterized protein
MKDKNPKLMDIQTIALIILTGLAAGIFSGLIGIGGGIIIVPALVMLVGFSQHQAQGTSLGMLMLPVGILGVINYYKKGYVDYRIVLILAIGFVIGAYFGSKLAIKLPSDTIKKIFAVVMILVAIRMLFFEKKSS